MKKWECGIKREEGEAGLNLRIENKDIIDVKKRVLEQSLELDGK